MLHRLYIHNFRSMENFALDLGAHPSTLLVGPNGSGKTTVGLALAMLQKAASGTNRVGDLIHARDFTQGRLESPMRIEVDIQIGPSRFTYSVALEMPPGFKEARVLEEKLTIDGATTFHRERAQVRLARAGQETATSFRIDWHLLALPIVQEQSQQDPIFIVKAWLANMLILRPVPSMMRGESNDETLSPDEHVSNLGAWFSGVIATAPSSYSQVEQFLKNVMPDIQDIKNPLMGRTQRELNIYFGSGAKQYLMPFDNLSDGEKCFLCCALAIAANKAYGPLLCFWDEPDNFLGPAEVGSTIVALRKAYRQRGQLIVTSHNPEAIRRFSDENTILFYRRGHHEPTEAQLLQDVRAKSGFSGSFGDAVVQGDVRP